MHVYHAFVLQESVRCLRGFNALPVFGPFSKHASGESFAAQAGPFRPTLRRLLLFLQLLRRYSSFALFALCGFGQYLSLLTSLDAVIIQQPQLLSGVRKEVSAHTLTGQANSGVYVRLCILSRGIISLDVIHSRTSLLGHPFCGT